jgi:hypothetical protein
VWIEIGISVAMPARASDDDDVLRARARAILLHTLTGQPLFYGRVPQSELPGRALVSVEHRVDTALIESCPGEPLGLTSDGAFGPEMRIRLISKAPLNRSVHDRNETEGCQCRTAVLLPSRSIQALASYNQHISQHRNTLAIDFCPTVLALPLASQVH